MSEDMLAGESRLGARWLTRPYRSDLSSLLETLFNFALLAYLALDGNIHGVPKVGNYVLTSLFWLGTVSLFLRTRACIRWELRTCQVGFVYTAFRIGSALWSTQPLSVTLVLLITLGCSFLYYNYLLERYMLEEFVRVLLLPMTVLNLLSLVVAAWAPSYGLDQTSDNYGAWQGLFGQKNLLGISAALTMGLALALRPRDLLDRVLQILAIVVSLVCSIKAESRESWIAIVLEIILLFFMRALARFTVRSRMPIIAATLVLFLASFALLYANLDAALALLGRTRDATGRADIWSDTLFLIYRRPWLGYGIAGVWHTPYAWDVFAREGWDVTSSHNDFLEITLEGGVVGLLLFLPLLILGFVNAFQALLSYAMRRQEVLVMLLSVIVVCSMAAPITTYPSSLAMVLLLYSVSCLELFRSVKEGTVAAFVVKGRPRADSSATRLADSSAD